jgi:hypothetical protein
MGLTDVESVVAWADQVIAVLPAPPMEVIDVALTGSRPPEEIVDLLGLVPGGGDLTAVAHCVLGLFLQRFRSGEIALERAVDMLWAYHNWAMIPDDERLRAGNFYDALFCAQRGYCGTLQSVREEILDFLGSQAAMGNSR